MNLKRLEAGLRSLVESQLLKAVPGQKPEDRVARRLIEAMEAGTQIDAGGDRVAPNVYTLLIHPDSVRYWRDRQLLQTITEVLIGEARESGSRLRASLSVALSPDAGMPPGEFQVVASHELAALGQTQDMVYSTPAIAQIDEASSLPRNAFLIVDGAHQYELSRPVVNIGRRLDNDLVIEDPRVSRHHAQVRAIKGRFVLFDLDSSGGTYVNGQRRSQSILEPGDVITLAGVSLIYGQDESAPTGTTHQTAPHEPEGAEGPWQEGHPASTGDDTEV